MHKIGSGVEDNSFQIDCCYTCGAKFLDYGELQRLRNSTPIKLEMPVELQNYYSNNSPSETKKPPKTLKNPSLGVASWLTDIIVKLL